MNPAAQTGNKLSDATLKLISQMTVANQNNAAISNSIGTAAATAAVAAQALQAQLTSAPNMGIVQSTISSPYYGTVWTSSTGTATYTPTILQSDPVPAEPPIPVCDKFVPVSKRAKKTVCKICSHDYEEHAEYTRDILLKLRKSLAA